jgi:hypothetical protein
MVTLPSTIEAGSDQLNGVAGIGYARFITDMDFSGLNKNGYSGTLRIMWRPEHLLRVGLETGYYRLYTFSETNIQTEFGTANVQSSLDAMPLLLRWAMQVSPEIEIFAGTGTTFLYTSFDSFGFETKSTQISTSYIVGGNYTYKISDKIELGGELKYYRINKIEDGTMTLQFLFIYKLFDW